MRGQLARNGPRTSPPARHGVFDGLFDGYRNPNYSETVRNSSVKIVEAGGYTKTIAQISYLLVQITQIAPVIVMVSEARRIQKASTDV